uniref:Uncharacterized protein n=1 Tax=Eutreptiella gymnastica TaxID=73025 RepID=A0A7S4G928_9EUGL
METQPEAVGLSALRTHCEMSWGDGWKPQALRLCKPLIPTTQSSSARFSELLPQCICTVLGGNQWFESSIDRYDDCSSCLVLLRPYPPQRLGALHNGRWAQGCCGNSGTGRCHTRLSYRPAHTDAGLEHCAYVTCQAVPDAYLIRGTWHDGGHAHLP